MQNYSFHNGVEGLKSQETPGNPSETPTETPGTPSETPLEMKVEYLTLCGRG